MMRRATRRIQHQGKPVRQAWAKPGLDFNSMASARGDHGRPANPAIAAEGEVDAFGLPPLPDESAVARRA
jgi:hypothetical protein